jgi:hypothetical protein
MWNQVYDPFSNTVLSTIAAALPVVTLLVLIASNKVKAHIAAIIALVVVIWCNLSVHDAIQLGSARHRFGRGHGVLPNRLDRAQCHLSLPAHRREGRI